MLEVAIASVKAVLPEEELQKVEMAVPETVALTIPTQAEALPTARQSMPSEEEEKYAG